MKTFSVNFHLQKHKKNKKGLCPIYMRVILNGRKIELSSHCFVKIGEWSKKNHKTTAKRKELRHINLMLENMRAEIYNCYRRLTEKSMVFDVKDIKSAFLKEEQTNLTVAQAIDAHNTNMLAQLGQGYSPGTYKNYKTLTKHYQGFLQQNNRRDIYVDNFKIIDIEDFVVYLKNHTPNNHNGAMKNVQRLKKIFSFCRHRSLSSNNPFEHYRIKFKPYVRGYLSLDQLFQIEQLELSPHLEVIRDIFVFACYTGLAYVDTMSLQKHHLKNYEGQLWVETQRRKTQSSSLFPLLPVALKILRKYENNGEYLFPNMSNNYINRQLKVIAKKCDIEKKLSFHMARHTFATSVTLNQGVPIETVSKMLGHAKLTTTQIYAQVLKTKISADMNLLSQKLQQKNLQINQQTIIKKLYK